MANLMTRSQVKRIRQELRMENNQKRRTYDKKTKEADSQTKCSGSAQTLSNPKR